MASIVKKIDIHHHVIPSFYTDALLESGIPTVTGGRPPAWSKAKNLEAMERFGIDKAYLSISECGVYFGDVGKARSLARQCNDFFAELVCAQAGRFGAFGLLPLPDVEAAIREFGHLSDELRLDGVVLNSSVDGRHIGDPAHFPLFEVLNDKGCVVFLHPVSPPFYSFNRTFVPSYYVDSVADTTKAVASLIWSGALERFPDIRWIVAHGGGAIPYLRPRLGLLSLDPTASQRFPRGVDHYLSQLYLETALTASRGNLELMLEMVGRSHLLFGSDLPFISSDWIGDMTLQLDRALVEMGLSEAVSRGNAVELFSRGPA